MRYVSGVKTGSELGAHPGSGQGKPARRFLTLTQTRRNIREKKKIHPRGKSTLFVDGSGGLESLGPICVKGVTDREREREREREERERG